MSKIKDIKTERLEQMRSTLQKRRNTAGQLSTKDALCLVAITNELDARHAR